MAKKKRQLTLEEIEDRLVKLENIDRRFRGGIPLHSFDVELELPLWNPLSYVMRKKRRKKKK